MRIIYASAFAIFLSLISPLSHADSVDELAKIKQATQTFSVGGVRLGIPIESFMRKFPKAKKLPVRADVYPKNDLYEMTVDNGTSHPPNVTFEFEDGALKIIAIKFSRESLKLVTKKGAMLRQLGSHFGNPRPVAKDLESDYGTVDVYGWDFSNIGRGFTYYAFHDGTAEFNAYAVPQSSDVRPKTSLLGFD